MNVRVAQLPVKPWTAGFREDGVDAVGTRKSVSLAHYWLNPRRLAVENAAQKYGDLLRLVILVHMPDTIWDHTKF